ncbi:MAG TPA: hypothetical protein VK728_10005 [Candidatus Sulfotelmatobacter sp.]|nr:hypothetical protein [Candidatus Sulfotelmatobacter sp.]
MNTDQEITVNDALRLTGYTRQQVYNILVARRVEARKLGHQYLINRRSLLEYLKHSRGPKTRTSKDS